MRLEKLLPLLVLVGAMAVPAAHAQGGLYVMYTGAGISGSQVSNVPNMYGPTIGAYLQNKHMQVVSAGVDFRGSFLSGNNQQSLDSVLAGFRLAIHPKVVPISPYGELLIGVANSTVGVSTTTVFQPTAVVGVDYTILPHLAWRVIELSYARVDAINAYNPTGLSSGVVLRF